MAVLMTYHKLVERDAKNVDFHWKAVSIILLILAIISSFAVSICLQSITYVYEDRCVLGATLRVSEYIPQTTGLSHDTVAKNQTAGEASESMTNSTAKLNEFFNETYSAYLDKKGREYPVNQIKTLAEANVNEQYAIWEEKTSCEFAIYMPIAQCCFGIIMTVMFIICGKGGKSDPHAFLPQPWRIVTPAIIFFLVMSILCIINIVIIESGMNKFCENLMETTPDIHCSVAISHFAVIKPSETEISPAIYHQMLTSFNYISLTCWFLSLIWMILRVIFVIDFQLVRITVKTVEYENAGDEKRAPSSYTVKDIQEEIDMNGKNDKYVQIATTEC